MSKIKTEYSDSLLPWGIGTSFLLLLVFLLAAGMAAGMLLRNAASFKGIPLLVIFLVLLAGPVVYNKKQSRFEKKRHVLDRINGIGTIQGLRGAIFVILMYKDGFEIRAFYHRFFIMYDKVQSISVTENSMEFPTGIQGFPERIISLTPEFLDFAKRLKNRSVLQSKVSI